MWIFYIESKHIIYWNSFRRFNPLVKNHFLVALGEVVQQTVPYLAGEKILSMLSTTKNISILAWLPRLFCCLNSFIHDSHIYWVHFSTTLYLLGCFVYKSWWYITEGNKGKSKVCFYVLKRTLQTTGTILVPLFIFYPKILLLLQFLKLSMHNIL